MMGAVNLKGEPVLFDYGTVPQVPAIEIPIREVAAYADVKALHLWQTVNTAAARLLWKG